jgi:formyl-CoA transferase
VRARPPLQNNDAMTDTAPNAAQGPLAGLRVIELGSLIAGPFCGQLLADFGADVIKIEPPGVGDPIRRWGRQTEDGTALWWSVIGRNKRSVTIDLRVADGQALARDLIGTADIVVENFRPGTLERWGLGYEQLSRDHPGLIMARMSGFGQDGPYKGRAGFGSVGEAMGGLRYVTGSPELPPSRCGIAIGDSLTGIFGALGILMAVRHRDRTGVGQIVDAALYESVLAVMESLVPDFDQTDYVRERTGAILKGVAPSNVYPCSDGLSVVIGANGDGVFCRLTEAMNRPDLLADDAFRSHDQRARRQEELDDIISDWSRTLPSSHVLDLMEQNGVPAGLIYRAPEMISDPHFQARQSIIDVPHPSLGSVKMQNTFPRMTTTPGGVRWPGAPLGAHTEEVLGGLLGLDADRQAALRSGGTI